MNRSPCPTTGDAALCRSGSGLLVAIAAACLMLFSGAALAHGPDTDRYIVQFKERGNSVAARQAISAAGGSVLLEVPAANAVAARIPAQALQGLRNNPNIALIEQDSPRFPMAQTVPYGITLVQADLVSDQSSGVKVCVIDSGFDAAHEDLQSSNVSGSNDGSRTWYTDTCGHGTHVAGTIMAQDNELGVVGVAPNVGLHIIKVFDGSGCGWSYSSNLINAAYACQGAGANIINMSLGCIDSGRGGPWSCSNSTENAAFEDLYNNHNVLSISSAGNNGTTARGYPASYPSVISVAAIDENKVVADFSQRNSDVELAAPGVGVLSTVPMGMGADVVVSVNGQGYEAEAMDGSAEGSVAGKAIVDCGLATQSCSAASGAICLIERGQISFADKVLNCQSGGGLGAIIYNNEPGMLFGTLGGANTSIPSVGISQADGHEIRGLSSPSGSVTVGVGHYARYSGTSMASPHVAGVAALVWAQFPGLSNAEIRTALQQSAEDLGATGRDNLYGYGLVRAQAAIELLGGGGPSDPPPGDDDDPPPGDDDPPGDPDPGVTAEVGSINLSHVNRGPNTRTTATVTIVDTSGNTLSGATVSGCFNGPSTGCGSGTTNGSGVVTFDSGNYRSNQTAGFCVNDVTGSGIEEFDDTNACAP